MRMRRGTHQIRKMSQSKKAGTIVTVAKPSYKRITIIAKDKQAPKKHTAGDQEKK